MDEQQIKRATHSDVVQAVRALANAAATMETTGVGDDAPQLWFVVRALCHEHGLDFVGVQVRACNVAVERAERFR